MALCSAGQKQNRRAVSWRGNGQRAQTERGKKKEGAEGGCPSRGLGPVATGPVSPRRRPGGGSAPPPPAPAAGGQRGAPGTELTSSAPPVPRAALALLSGPAARAERQAGRQTEGRARGQTEGEKLGDAVRQLGEDAELETGGSRRSREPGGHGGEEGDAGEEEGDLSSWQRGEEKG